MSRIDVNSTFIQNCNESDFNVRKIPILKAWKRLFTFHSEPKINLTSMSFQHDFASMGSVGMHFISSEASCFWRTTAVLEKENYLSSLGAFHELSLSESVNACTAYMTRFRFVLQASSGD
jgi:hypothetical protein